MVQDYHVVKFGRNTSRDDFIVGSDTFLNKDIPPFTQAQYYNYGSCPIVSARIGPSNWKMNGLYKADLSGINWVKAPEDIQYARLYIHGSITNGTVRRMFVNWLEGDQCTVSDGSKATWLRRGYWSGSHHYWDANGANGAGDRGDIESSIVSAGDGWYYFDVKDSVDYWLFTSPEYYGWLIEGVTGNFDSSEAVDQSLRPYVEVAFYGSSSSSSSSSRSSSSSSSSSQSSSSSSSSSASYGDVTYGYPSATETFKKTFAAEWSSGPGVVISGIGAAETIRMQDCGVETESDPWHLGVLAASIKIDKYQTGSGPAPIIQYKTGATEGACIADTWNVYNGVWFACLGWVKVKFIKNV